VAATRAGSHASWHSASLWVSIILPIEVFYGTVASAYASIIAILQPKMRHPPEQSYKLLISFYVSFSFLPRPHGV
jgi:hypothetical protein